MAAVNRQHTYDFKGQTGALSYIYRVQTPCRASTVSLPLKTTLLNGWNGDTRCVATTLILHLRENAAPAKCEIRMAGLSHIANIGTNRSEWWLFTLILFTCLISFTIHDFKNDTEQVPLALQIVAFLQTLPAY